MLLSKSRRVGGNLQAGFCLQCFWFGTPGLWQANLDCPVCPHQAGQHRAEVSAATSVTVCPRELTAWAVLCARMLWWWVRGRGRVGRCAGTRGLCRECNATSAGDIPPSNKRCASHLVQPPPPGSGQSSHPIQLLQVVLWGFSLY